MHHRLIGASDSETIIFPQQLGKFNLMCFKAPKEMKWRRTVEILVVLLRDHRMHSPPLASKSETAVKIRSLVFVLLGVAVLVLKHQYTGPLGEVVQSYAGNLSVSFALFFNFMFLPLPARIRRPVAALLAFAAVELFEVFDGFGIMANTYDPVDLVVNPIGIALGIWLDAKLSTVRTRDASTNPS